MELGRRTEAPFPRPERPSDLIRLILFGSPDLVGPAGEKLLSVLSQPKRLVLLARLALAGDRGVRRDALLAEFWPDSDDAHARNALNQSLHHLRRSLGNDVIVSRPDDVVAVRGDLLWCDAVAFDDAVAGGHCAAAADAYTGSFLDGVGVPEWNVGQWLEEERQRLESAAARAGWRAAEEALDAGRKAEAAARARQAAALTPLDEVAARRLMELLARLGDRGGGLEAFRTLRARLAEELQVAPSPETVALAESLRSESADPSPQPTPVRPRRPPVPEGAVGAIGKASLPPARRLRGVLGRSGALALVGAGVLAYYFGVSDPVGRWKSLVARGGLEAGGQVLLTDFADATGEDLGRVVTEVLRVDLSESSVLALVDKVALGPALDRMRVDPGAELTARMGRQLALREGIPAVIEGDISRAGTGYIVTARIRHAASGRLLASSRVTAEGPASILGAIDELSRDVRARSGEPLGRIRSAKPLAQVTTGSLEALRLYTEAADAFSERNDRRGSAELLERALAHDSTFAMAWRMLWVALQDGADPLRRREAAAQAFRYRDRLPEIERYLVEASYYASVGERGRTIDAYESVLRVDPDHPTALNNLAFQYRVVDELARAEELLRRAVTGPAPSSSAYLSLLLTQLSLDRAEDAAATLRELEDAFPEYQGLDRRRFQVLFLQGDTAAAAAIARRNLAEPVAAAGDRARWSADLAGLARWSGRLDEARALDREAVLLAAGEGPEEGWARRVSASYEEALAADPRRGGAYLREGLVDALGTLAPQDVHFRSMVIVFADAGDPQAVERVLDAWRDVRAAGDSVPRRGENLEQMTLYARVMRGDTVGAAATLDRLVLEANCGDPCWIFPQARIRDRLGQHERAIERYEKIRRGGYTNWGWNIGQRLYAMRRLGPLYEEVGDTARAVEAYRRVLERWAGADAGGRETVRRFEERLAALGLQEPREGDATGRRDRVDGVPGADQGGPGGGVRRLRVRPGLSRPVHPRVRAARAPRCCGRRSAGSGRRGPGA